MEKIVNIQRNTRCKTLNKWVSLINPIEGKRSRINVRCGLETIRKHISARQYLLKKHGHVKRLASTRQRSTRRQEGGGRAESVGWNLWLDISVLNHIKLMTR